MLMQVCIAGVGAEAHGRQGRMSATLLAFPPWSRMEAEAPASCRVFQAEKKQKGTGAHIGSKAYSDTIG